MSTGDLFSQIVSFFFGLLTIILWLVTFSRIGGIRDEARRQTELLEQIARNTKPPGDAPKPAASLDYMRDPQSKTGIYLFLAALGVITAVLFLLAMASKR